MRRSSQVSAWTASVWSSGVRGLGLEHLSYRSQVVHGADLVVDQHYRDHSDVGVDKVGQGVKVDATGAVHRADPAAETLGAVQHGVVLSGRGDHRPAQRGAHPEQRQIVGLGPAGGEHHLAGLATEQFSDRVPGIVEGPPGVTSGAVGLPTGCRTAR